MEYVRTERKKKGNQEGNGKEGKKERKWEVKGIRKEKKRNSAKMSTIQFTASEKARQINLEIGHGINET